jgi:hypothetical protein
VQEVVESPGITVTRHARLPPNQHAVIAGILNDLTQHLQNAIVYHLDRLLGTDWSFVVSSPPPWTIPTMVYLIKRHWPACFIDVCRSAQVTKPRLDRMAAFVQLWNACQGEVPIDKVFAFMEDADSLLCELYEDVQVSTRNSVRETVDGWWKELNAIASSG